MRHTSKYCLVVVLILLNAFWAFAQFSIYSHDNVSSDKCWIQPCIRIQNISSNSLHLKDYIIEYYFYVPDHVANQYTADIWYFSNGNSRVYTSFEDYPPFTNGDKKANIKCVITFSSSNYNILEGNGNYDELELGMRYVYDWGYEQEQTDDWSYVAGQDWQVNENIVVKDLNGNIVYGKEPGNNVQKPDPVPMKWLGLIDNATFEEIQNAGLFEDGDAYKNGDDNKSYVRYKGEWQEIGGGDVGDLLNGFTMNPGNTGIRLNEGDIFQALGVGGLYADFKQNCEANYFCTDYINTAIPDSPTANVGFNEGTFLVGQLEGEWYLFVKVQHDPTPLWKRILIPDWK